ncbi:syntaxin 1A isoform 1 [Aphelenchoides avenae]|nr:syntaxin 1A isoform 1 [Aphelenchus avenae]
MTRLTIPGKQDELNELQADVKKNINKAIAKLREMDNAIEKELDATPRRSSQDQQGEYVAASIRMKQGQHAALHRRLKTIMEEYNQAITNFEEKQKEDQKRRIKISVGDEVPEDEINRIVEGGQDLGQIFTGIQANARDLADIEARHNDIMKLEQSIRELHDMFVDMATLVESQGALVDRIEANVENTKDYVGTAVKETKQAMQYQKSAAKKKLAMLVCLSVVVGLLVLLVLSYVPMPF